MIALYIVVFWAFVAVVAVTWIYYSHNMRLTSYATGAVISAENREVHDKTHGRQDRTVIVCQYVVSGKKYQVSKVFRGRNADRFPVGREFQVRYDPAHPEKSQIPD